MTFEAAKARAFGAAFAVFTRMMRRLVGEDGLARLAGQRDEHLLFVSVDPEHVMSVHITIEYGPIEEAPGLAEALTSSKTSDA